jgi:predicted DNA-binding protein (MmcQ/YjbR family)
MNPAAVRSQLGLGKAGWVTVRIGADTPFEMLRQWVDESYRTVAPKALAARSG